MKWSQDGSVFIKLLTCIFVVVAVVVVVVVFVVVDVAAADFFT